MRKSLFRGVLGIAMSLNVALLPTLAQADVASAFKSLLADGATVSTQAPGQFSSQARNSFVAGGVDVRFPTHSAPAILSVTPFRVQAGCGGVSLFFGGFSFISGAEIVALIKAVAQNAVGLAVELVMTTLCGPCASVMQIMRKLALDAANGALNSCQIAKSLMQGAESAMGVNPGQQSTTQNTCTELGTMWGWITDSSAGQTGSASATSTCNQMGSAITNSANWIGQELNKINIAAGSPLGQRQLCKAGTTCNVIWTMLNQTDLYDNSNTDNIRDKLLLMNMTGTTIITAGNATPNAKNPTPNMVVPTSTIAGSNTANNANLNTNFTSVNYSLSSSYGGTPQPGAPSSLTVAPQGNACTGSALDPLTCSGPVPTAGATASTATSPGIDNANTAGSNQLAPTLGIDADDSANGIKTVFKLLECGVPGVSPNPTVTDPTAQGLINAECTYAPDSSGTSFSLARLQVMDCADSSDSGFLGASDSGYTSCLSVYRVPLGSTYLGQNEGYLPYVVNLLFGGIASVQNNQPLDPNLIALIQEVPVPIYQAINVAAVYPDAGYQLISSMSVNIAQLLIYEHVRDLVQVAGRFHNDLMMSQADLDRVLKLFGQIEGATQKDKAEIATEMARQQLMMSQIRQINLAIQNEVMTPELLGAHRYGTALAQKQ